MNEFDRRKTCRPSNFAKKNIFRLCLTEGKHFDRVRPRSFLTEKKSSTAFDERFSQLRSVSTAKFVLAVRPSENVSTEKNLDCGRSSKKIQPLKKQVIRYVMRILLLKFSCIYVSSYVSMCVCMVCMGNRKTNFRPTTL